MKRLGLAWLACSGTNVLLGVLFHRIVMGERIEAFFRQLGSPPTPALALGTHLVITTAMVYLYPRFYRGGSPALEGYKLGVVVGALVISPVVFVFLIMGIEWSTIVLDGLWHVFVEEPITGMVLGLVYARVRSSP